jgi:hypothetical protein
MPEELNDRAQEGCEILVAIADALGCGAETRAALVELFTIERLDDLETARMQLLRDIRLVYERRQMPKAIYTENLLVELRDLDESPWKSWYGRGLDERDLAGMLRGYRVRPTTVREPVRLKSMRDNHRPAKGYRRDDFVEVWDRYL